MQTAAPATSPRWLTALEGLGARPGLLLAVALLANALLLPYQGRYPDARLYAAAVVERAAPGTFADDLYLRFGSQDRYSAFSLVMTPLVQLLGLEPAFFLVYLASKVLFFWGVVLLLQ